MYVVLVTSFTQGYIALAECLIEVREEGGKKRKETDTRALTEAFVLRGKVRTTVH